MSDKMPIIEPKSPAVPRTPVADTSDSFRAEDSIPIVDNFQEITSMFGEVTPHAGEPKETKNDLPKLQKTAL